MESSAKLWRRTAAAEGQLKKILIRSDRPLRHSKTEFQQPSGALTCGFKPRRFKARSTQNTLYPSRPKTLAQSRARPDRRFSLPLTPVMLVALLIKCRGLHDGLHIRSAFLT